MSRPLTITPAAMLVAMNDWRTRRRRGSLARRLPPSEPPERVVEPAVARRDDD